MGGIIFEEFGVLCLVSDWLSIISETLKLKIQHAPLFTLITIHFYDPFHTTRCEISQDGRYAPGD